MRKTGPSRPNKQQGFSGEASIEELTEAWFEILERPGVAEAAKKLADKKGTSVGALMIELIANNYHEHGKPLPDRLRQHIANHSDMSAAKRKKLLTFGLS